jgi:general secretion pathway protein G
MKKDVPLDPWNHAYVYRCPGQHGDFDLIALGADGQEGGEGDNRDITN